MTGKFKKIISPFEVKETPQRICPYFFVIFLRWTKSQAVWVGLYTNLDQFGEWLDQADRMVLDISKGQPLKDMKQKQKDLEKQVSKILECIE